VTTTDIAEYLDVTPQAVRNRANDVAEHEEVEKGNVGQSSVYWLAQEGTPAEVQETSSPPQDPPKGDKGLLQRLFADSAAFGAPVEQWTFYIIAAVTGLAMGVSGGILALQPPLGIQLAAISATMLIGSGATLPLALYYAFGKHKDTSNTDNRVKSYE
jgi:hypothetical protein